MIEKLQGVIGPLTVPALIQEICGHHATGTLFSVNEGISKKLFIDEGRVIFASSTDPDDRLGQLFLRNGMITLPLLIQAVDISQRDAKRLGAVLVEMKAIRSQDLIWGVAEQVKSMVIRLFDWTAGHYRFDEEKLPTKEVITLKMPTADLVLAGVKSIEAWSRIEAAVGGLDSPYHTGPRLKELAEELDLSLDEWSLLSRCESGATLGQICENSTMGDFDTCRLVWALTVVGVLERQAQAATGAVS